MTPRVVLALCAAVVVGALAASSAFGQAAFGDGIYRVGKDIKAGTYRTLGGNGCYWARLSGFTGDLNQIRANDNAYGPAIVTILPSDKGFETERCGNWTRGLRRITASKTRFGEGTFAVGIDIAPGTYRNSGGSGCYWARLSGFTGDLSGILANDNVSGRTIVTIKSSDKGFTSSRCGRWSRV